MWGDTPEKQRIHLVNWETICYSRRKGGLGMRHLKERNQAYMMKLGWNLITRKDDFWLREVWVWGGSCAESGYKEDEFECLVRIKENVE